MAIIPLGCPHCHSWRRSKFGKTRTGGQRYVCNNASCLYQTFTLEPHADPGRRQEVKVQIMDGGQQKWNHNRARVLGFSTA